MECIIGLIVIIIGIVYLSETVVGKMMWCEKCNSWEKMKMKSGEISGWNCPSCDWINQKQLGSCPTCNWYEKYEIKTVSHRGPFKKVDSQNIDMFYAVDTTYYAYEEKIECPKHGVFTAYIPVDVYESSVSQRNTYFEKNNYHDEQDDYEDDRTTKINPPIAPILPSQKLQKSEPSPQIQSCPQCGIPMKIAKATKGEFLGQNFYVCPNFKKCNQYWAVG